MIEVAYVFSLPISLGKIILGLVQELGNVIKNKESLYLLHYPWHVCGVILPDHKMAAVAPIIIASETGNKDTCL
jgi:hypothetical protein